MKSMKLVFFAVVFSVTFLGSVSARAEEKSTSKTSTTTSAKKKSVNEGETPEVQEPAALEAKAEEVPAPAPAEPEEPASEKRWRFGGGIYHSNASILEFLKWKENGVSQEMQFNLESAPGIELTVTYGTSHAWGMQAGMHIDGARKIKSYEVKSNGVTTTTSLAGAEPTAHFYDLYANALYKWECFYLPFGLNVGGMGIDGTARGLKSSGASGGQFGAGWDLGEHFAIEILFKLLSVNVEKSDVGGVTIEPSAGSFSGLSIGVKGYF